MDSGGERHNFRIELRGGAGAASLPPRISAPTRQQTSRVSRTNWIQGQVLRHRYRDVCDDVGGCRLRHIASLYWDQKACGLHHHQSDAICKVEKRQLRRRKPETESWFNGWFSLSLERTGAARCRCVWEINDSSFGERPNALFLTFTRCDSEWSCRDRGDDRALDEGERFPLSTLARFHRWNLRRKFVTRRSPLRGKSRSESPEEQKNYFRVNARRFGFRSGCRVSVMSVSLRDFPRKHFSQFRALVRRVFSFQFHSERGKPSESARREFSFSIFCYDRSWKA